MLKITSAVLKVQLCALTFLLYKTYRRHIHEHTYIFVFIFKTYHICRHIQKHSEVFFYFNSFFFSEGGAWASLYDEQTQI